MNDSFLNACRCRPVERIPVWLMRQAGRYMPEYRALRAKHSLLDMIRDPALACEVTMQPVDAFGVDAAIIFSDILPILEGFGMKLSFVSGQGPVFDKPLTPDAVERLPETADPAATAFTPEAIRLVIRELDGRIPLIGFTGAPFTLACYAIEGRSSRDYVATRRFMYNHPDAWHGLMEKIARGAADYLIHQIEAGVQVYQMFDSWAGMLGPDDYREYVLPYSRYVFDTVAMRYPEIPSIHFATGSSGILGELREAGGTVIGIDWRIDMLDAWNRLGGQTAVQGNLDPTVLFADEPVIRRRTEDLLNRVGSRPGYIFNLGHGVLKETDPEKVRYLVDLVHAFKPAPAGQAG